jgi:gas vesicle protein
MKEFPSKRIKYSWFRPETGKIVRSKNIKTKGDLEFQVPDTISKDWVLILDKIE